MTGKPARRASVMVTALLGGAIAALAGYGGFIGSRHIDPGLFAGLLKYAVGIVGVVWLFSLTVYQKLSDVTDMPGLDFRQHRNLEVEIRARLNWFWMRAMFLASMALALYIPTILLDSKMAVPTWVFGAACAALAVSVYSLWGLWHELEEIRELRSHIKEVERREADRASQVKSLKDARKGEWEKDERLEGFRSSSPKE